MSSSRVLDLLRSMDLFTDLPDVELAKIARLLKEHKIAENQVVFGQGDSGDGLPNGRTPTCRNGVLTSSEWQPLQVLKPK